MTSPETKHVTPEKNPNRPSLPSEITTALQAVLQCKGITDVHFTQESAARRGTEVWRAMHDGKEVAIKIYTGSATPSQREAGALYALQDEPYVPHIYCCETVDDNSYLITEWVTGPSIAELSKAVHDATEDEHKQAARETLLRGLTDAAVTLEHIHTKNILHGDIQPAHFSYQQTSEENAEPPMKVLDWGLAIQTNDASPAPHPGAFVHYAAPEIAQRMLDEEANTNYSAKAEVYAFCATCFFLLTRNTVVDYGEEVNSMARGPERLKACLQKITSGTAQSETAMPDWVPEAMQAIIKKGLSQNPDDRPSMTEITRTFQQS